MYKRRTKFNVAPDRAVTCRCNKGHTHGSQAEASYCDMKHWDMADLNYPDKITSIENQPRIALIAGLTWRLDFRIHELTDSGTPWSYLVDVKGATMREFEMKLALYRYMLEEDMVTEPMLIAYSHHSKRGGRKIITFSDKWYGRKGE